MSHLHESLRRAAAAFLEVLGVRGFLRRQRRRAKLATAREKVASALAEGKLSPAVAEALTGHLDGLQRDCDSSRED